MAAASETYATASVTVERRDTAGVSGLLISVFPRNDFTDERAIYDMTHVLVPLDGSDGAEASLAYALDLFPEGRFTLLAVVDPTSGFSGAGAPGTSEVWYRNARRQATEHLDGSRATAEERGVEVTTAVETGRPARVIVEYADEHDVDHVVMGTQGREGVSRLLTGSVAEGVVRHATVPVTVVR